MSLDLTGINANAYKDYMLQNADNIYSESLKNKIDQAGRVSKSGEGEEVDEKLMDACNQFEAYFLEQVFKEMEKSVKALKTDEGESTQLVDFFKERTVQDITLESTKTQGLGFAQMLYENMKNTVSATKESLLSEDEGHYEDGAEETDTETSGPSTV